MDTKYIYIAVIVILAAVALAISAWLIVSSNKENKRHIAENERMMFRYKQAILDSPVGKTYDDLKVILGNCDSEIQLETGSVKRWVCDDMCISLEFDKQNVCVGNDIGNRR